MKDAWLGTAIGTLALVSILAAGAGRAGALQAPEPVVESTVSGVLVSADPNLNRVVIRPATGEELGWQLASDAVREAGRHKAGDPVTVVYRTIGPGESSVRALMFTGTGSRPSYVNATGGDAVLRTAPMVGGKCGRVDPPASQIAVYALNPNAGTEDAAACWCCGRGLTTCRPSNPVRPRDHVILAACFD
jgi:hypothetical protein